MRERLPTISIATHSLLVAYLTDKDELWVDETITLNFIHRMDAVELLTQLPQAQPHFPTYYLLMDFFGIQAMSMLSVLCFPITVLATIHAGEVLYPKRNAHMAGLLVAVSPFLATQAGWIRMYSPLIALLTLGLWMRLEGRTRASLLCMIGATLLHPFGLFGVVWLSYTLIVEYEAWTIGAVSLSVAILPLLALLIVNYRDGLTEGSTGVTHGLQPDLLRIVLTPVSSVVGAHYTLSLLIVALLLTPLLFVPVPDYRLFIWILIPIAGVTIASYLVVPLFRPKYFGMIAPAVALLISQPRDNWQIQYSIYLMTALLIAMQLLFRLHGLILTRYYQFSL